MAARAGDAREVRQAEIACERCGSTFEVAHGVVNLLADVPAFVEREAAGLERFAQEMRASGWDREQILALPENAHGYWTTQRRAIGDVLALAAFEPGQRLLDVGSNTCWASAIFGGSRHRCGQGEGQKAILSRALPVSRSPRTLRAGR
jgi:hypothetical protein